MSKTSFKTTVEWQSINWRQLERRVFKLQKRIFKATQRGDIKTVRKLQRTMMKSWAARSLAIRRVVQQFYYGNKIAGVKAIAVFTPEQYSSLIAQLKVGIKAQQAYWVRFVKSRTQEKRPLGMAALKDRGLQMLVKLVLEPEWEAHCEGNLLGFGSGRPGHDAVEVISNVISDRAQYLLDADVINFDRINLDTFLDKLHASPPIRRQIKAWLQAGIMRHLSLSPVEGGTRPGDILLPLLTHVALHGLENRINEDLLRLEGASRAAWVYQEAKYSHPPNLIHYLDRFVLFHEDLAVVENCQEIIVDWLRGLGLALNPSKTRLAHMLHGHGDEQPGLDFLGFNIRQFPVARPLAAIKAGESHTRFQTIITPSKVNRKEHYRAIAEIIETHKGVNQVTLIKLLNPVISSWCHYYSGVVKKQSFLQQDYLMFQKLVAWARHRHADKSWAWISRKYWQTQGINQWVFATPSEDKDSHVLRRYKAI